MILEKKIFHYVIKCIYIYICLKNDRKQLSVVLTPWKEGKDCNVTFAQIYILSHLNGICPVAGQVPCCFCFRMTGFHRVFLSPS